jgi:hypothetical protein
VRIPRRGYHPKAEDYFNALSTGLLGGKCKPINLLISQISYIKEMSFGRVHDIVRLAMLVNSWNVFAVGKRGTKPAIEWDVSRPFPVVEGT